MNNKENENEYNTLDNAGVFYFNEAEIDMGSVKAPIEWFLEQEFKKKKKKKLTFIITSWGGSMDATFALIDVMNSISIPIRTVGLGTIASCGLLLFINGKERVLTPNTSILSHQFSFGSYGKDHELVAIEKEIDLTRKRMMDHYKKCLKMSKKEIKKHLLPASDVWLSAEEALDLGICDKVAYL